MINTTGNKIPLQHVEVSDCGHVVHHHRTVIFTEGVTALFRLRDRPRKGSRSLGGELLTSQIFHSDKCSDKWSDKHWDLKLEQLWKAL